MVADGFRRLKVVESAGDDSDEDDVLGDDANRQRAELNPDDEYLETEEDVPAGDLEEFADRMSSPEINAERGLSICKMYRRERAELRLKHTNPDAYTAYAKGKSDRARGVDPP